MCSEIAYDVLHGNRIVLIDSVDTNAVIASHDEGVLMARGDLEVVGGVILGVNCLLDGNASTELDLAVVREGDDGVHEVL